MFELVIVSQAIKMTMKTGLQSVTVHDVELFRQNDSRSFPFFMLVFELARMVSEFLGLFREELRYNTSSVVFVGRQRKLWSVNEDVFLPGVAVHVNVCHNVFILNLWTVGYCHFFSWVWSFSVD